MASRRKGTRGGCTIEALTSDSEVAAQKAPSRFWAHGLGVAWLVGAAGVVLLPVLAHGSSFGPFDLMSVSGLLQRHGVVIHNAQAGDQVDAILPWTTLAWTQVHHGQIPLWNPYSALGTPLAFNFQTGAFGLQALIGYLFPLRLAYTVQVVATLIIAGTGAYVFGRVMRLGILACVFAGTVFELSGPVVGWLGWPHAAVISFAGWWFAAALLVVRGRHRARDIAFFAVVMAFAIYAGEVEIFTLMALALGLFLVVLLVQRSELLGGSGPVLRPVVDLAVAGIAGAALAAPLLLPGLALGSGSLRDLAKPDVALPALVLTHVLFSSFDGLPVHGSPAFSVYGLFYTESAAYVGVMAVVLGGVAVVLRRRRPEVVALAVVVLGTLSLAFVAPVMAIMNSLPVIGHVGWHLALLPMAFALAALGGVGVDLLVRSPLTKPVRTGLGWGFLAVGVVLLALWLFGRGQLPPFASSIRARSFLWPTIETLVGLTVVATLSLAARRDGRVGATAIDRGGLRAGTWSALALLVCETAFLVASGAPLWTSSSTFFAPTPGVLSLRQAVGSSLVGFGPHACLRPPGLGIPEDENVAYGVRELAAYDPFLQRIDFSSWHALTGRDAGFREEDFYCPDVTSATLARLYGVGFVLENSGTPGPAGGVFDERIGDEDLYRIPGAAAATLTALAHPGTLPPVEAVGTPVAVTHPDAASWKIVTDASSPQVLRLRLTDVAGWHATVDGRPLALEPFAGVMLQAVVPAGHHTVELHYWPDTLSAGLYLAAISLVGLGTGLVVAGVRRRRGHKGVAPQARVTESGHEPLETVRK